MSSKHVHLLDDLNRDMRIIIFYAFDDVFNFCDSPLDAIPLDFSTLVGKDNSRSLAFPIIIALLMVQGANRGIVPIA